MATFQFPLEDQNDYKGRIRFQAIQEDYRTVVSKVLDTGGYDTVGTGVITQGEQKTVNTGKPSRSYLDSVSLFLPQAISFRDAAEYTNVDLGSIGAGVALGIRNGANGAAIMRNAAAKIAETFDNLGEAFNRGLKSEAAQIAALKMAGKVSPGVEGAIETETGITLNPNRRSTFKGIGLRRFNFSFQLIPTSAEEARQVRQIIAFFRQNMYPEMSSFEAADLSVALKFPSKFSISASYGGRRVGGGILPCFLENVGVTYNPNAMAWHSDGEPVETVIDLGFIEERALTKEDIQTWNAQDGIGISG